jgi:hypothetical protein
VWTFGRKRGRMRCRKRRKCVCSRHVQTERHKQTDPSSEPLTHQTKPRHLSLPTRWLCSNTVARAKYHHPEGTTEFEILKSSHRYVVHKCTSGGLTRLCRFLRPDDEGAKDLSWNDKVAKKYYDSLYKEFAVCDLKHYKSGNVREPSSSRRRNL